MNETIAAIATAAGNSGIGIIRVSGDEAIKIVDKVFKNKTQTNILSNSLSHTIHYGYIYDGDEIIDEVMVSIFLSPKSFTTEDTVEINCHGGIFVTRKILNLLLKNGARCALPGEFTKRAFLNGRIDLSKAEAVIDVINSKNDFALKNSIRHLNGTVYNNINNLRNVILHETAFIEAALDDPEHISLDGYYDKLNVILNDVKDTLESIILNFNNGKILKDGINTVIVGKPNAGKSSIMNKIIGRDRAIVTDIAGTTRDVLEENVSINGIMLNLIDTAGVRETDDIIEKIGVEKTLSEINNADLVFYVVDSSSKLDDDDKRILNLIYDMNVIIILNKNDLHTVTSTDEILNVIKKPIVSVSSLTGDGIDKLFDLIYDMFIDGKIEEDDQLYITNLRQKESIESSLNSINLVLNSIENKMPEDFLTIDLMDAYSSLGEVIGEDISEDLVDKIFSDFCMGK